MMTDDPGTAALVTLSALSTAYGAVETTQQRQAAKGAAHDAEVMRRRQEREAKRRLALEIGERERAQGLASMRARRAASGATGLSSTSRTGPLGVISPPPVSGKTLIGM